MTAGLWYICFIAGVGASYLFEYFPVLTAVFFFLLCASFYRSKGPRGVLYAAVTLAAFAYAHAGAGAEGPAASLESRGRQPFVAVVSGLPVTAGQGWIQEVSLSLPSTGLRSFMTTARPLEPGSRIQGVGYVKVGKQHLNPGSNRGDPALFLKAEGDVLVSREDSIRWFPQRMRWRLYNYFKEHFSPDAAVLLSAIIIGHREGGDGRLYRAYSRAGLAHLMSISGTHFALFSILVFHLVRISARGLPYRCLVRLTSRVSLDEVAVLTTLPLIVFYLLLSGGRVPALRSFLMMNIFLVGLLLGRRGQWLLSLLFAATVILLLDPRSLGTVSFQLSFMAVFFIGTTLEAFEVSPYPDGPRPASGRIPRVILVAAGALIGTGPLALYYFHSISTFSMPANLTFTPLICFVVLPAGLFGSVIYLATGFFPLAGVLERMVELLNSSVTYVSGLDGATLPVRAFPALFLFPAYGAIFLCMKRMFRWAAASLAVLAVVALPTFLSLDGDGPAVTFLDVGQGDAAVVESSGGRTVVVDTGHTGREVIGFLRYMGIGEVDALVISHGGSDHAGGLWNILAALPVREVWDNGLVRYSPAFGPAVVHRRLTAGDLLESGGSRFLVLHPLKGYYSISGEDDNNHSLVLRFSDGPLSVLFTGDIEADAEEALLSHGDALGSRVLKVAHHGSHTSSTTPFVSAVGPEVAVISVGAGNPYGHPHRAALRRLSGTVLLRTDLGGAVKVGVDPVKGLVVKEFRDFVLKRVPYPGSPEEMRNLKRAFLLW